MLTFDTHGFPSFVLVPPHSKFVITTTFQLFSIIGSNLWTRRRWEAQQSSELGKNQDHETNFVI